MSSLKILTFSDFHAYFQQVRYFKSIKMALTQHEPDVLVLCGDFVVNSKLRQIEYLLKSLNFKNIFHVWGNSDEFEPEFRLKNSINLHLNPIQFKNFTFIGIGGDEVDCKLNAAELEEKLINIKDPIILVSHVPPKGACDLCNDGRSVGVHELKSIIEKFQPRIHLFGHIHEAKGYCKIKSTTFINVGAEGTIVKILNERIDVKFL